MAKIQVGSTFIQFNEKGEVISEVVTPSYLLNDDGTKVELTKDEEKKYGIGDE